MPLPKKPKTLTKTKILGEKKHDVLDFWNALSFIFFILYKKKLKLKIRVSLGFFFDKGTPYFDCIKAQDLRLD